MKFTFIFRKKRGLSVEVVLILPEGFELAPLVVVTKGLQLNSYVEIEMKCVSQNHVNNSLTVHN